MSLLECLPLGPAVLMILWSETGAHATAGPGDLSSPAGSEMQDTSKASEQRILRDLEILLSFRRDQAGRFQLHAISPEPDEGPRAEQAVALDSFLTRNPHLVRFVLSRHIAEASRNWNAESDELVPLIYHWSRLEQSEKIGARMMGNYWRYGAYDASSIIRKEIVPMVSLPRLLKWLLGRQQE